MLFDVLCSLIFSLKQEKALGFGYQFFFGKVSCSFDLSVSFTYIKNAFDVTFSL